MTVTPIREADTSPPDPQTIAQMIRLVITRLEGVDALISTAAIAARSSDVTEAVDAADVLEHHAWKELKDAIDDLTILRGELSQDALEVQP